MLVCIDFDNTITTDNTHNILRRSSHKDLTSLITKVDQESEDAQWELVKHVLPTGSSKNDDEAQRIQEKARQWKAALEKLDRDGHEIAIVSYNKYPHIVERYLRVVIGIEESLLKKIKIVSDFPKLNYSPGEMEPGTIHPDTFDQDLRSDLHVVGKVQHIEVARAYFEKLRGCPYSDDEIVLFDDNEDNVMVARSSNHIGIKVDRNGDNNPISIITAMEQRITNKSQFNNPQNFFQPAAATTDSGVTTNPTMSATITSVSR